MVPAIILASDKVTDSWNIGRGIYPYVNNIKSLNHSLQQKSKQKSKQAGFSNCDFPKASQKQPKLENFHAI